MRPIPRVEEYQVLPCSIGLGVFALKRRVLVIVGEEASGGSVGQQLQYHSIVMFRIADSESQAWARYAGYLGGVRVDCSHFSILLLLLLLSLSLSPLSCLFACGIPQQYTA